jgi:hypothetical protein
MIAVGGANFNAQGSQPDAKSTASLANLVAESPGETSRIPERRHRRPRLPPQ